MEITCATEFSMYDPAGKPAVEGPSAKDMEPRTVHSVKMGKKWFLFLCPNCDF